MLLSYKSLRAALQLGSVCKKLVLVAQGPNHGVRMRLAQVQSRCRARIARCADRVPQRKCQVVTLDGRKPS
jgi:hypothetical protein